MKNINKIIIVVFIAVVFFIGCNKPSDPDLQVMAVGSWDLVDLLMDDQKVSGYSNEFVLNLFDDETCVFINHDGIGFTGTWSVDEKSSILLLTPNNENYTAINFDIMYLRPGEMGLQRTITSTLIGTRIYTYILVD
jgi:hypothetical protein